MSSFSSSRRVNMSPETDVFSSHSQEQSSWSNVVSRRRRLPSLTKSKSHPVLLRRSTLVNEAHDSPTPKSRFVPSFDASAAEFLFEPPLSSTPIKPITRSATTKPRTVLDNSRHPARVRTQTRHHFDAACGPESPSLSRPLSTRPSPPRHNANLRSSSHSRPISLAGAPSKAFPGSMSLEEGFRVASRGQQAIRPVNRVSAIPQRPIAPDWAAMKAEHDAVTRPAGSSQEVDGLTERTARLSLGRAFPAHTPSGVVGAIAPRRPQAPIPAPSLVPALARTESRLPSTLEAPIELTCANEHLALKFVEKRTPQDHRSIAHSGISSNSPISVTAPRTVLQSSPLRRRIPPIDEEDVDEEVRHMPPSRTIVAVDKVVALPQPNVPNRQPLTTLFVLPSGHILGKTKTVPLYRSQAELSEGEDEESDKENFSPV